MDERIECDYCGSMFKDYVAFEKHLDYWMNKSNGHHDFTIEEYYEYGLPINFLHLYQMRKIKENIRR